MSDASAPVGVVGLERLREIAGRCLENLDRVPTADPVPGATIAAPRRALAAAGGSRAA